MLDVVRKAIKDVMFEIPRPILEEAFLNNRYYKSRNLSSLDECIYHDVFRARVESDINLIGGQTVEIPVSDCSTKLFDLQSVLIDVPLTATNGLSIVSVLSLNYYRDVMSYSAHFGAGAPNSGLLGAAQAAVRSVGSIPVVSTDVLKPITDRKILVKGLSIIPQYAYLVVTLENEAGLTNINPRSIPYFSELFEYAVKAHCYNELIIGLGEGKLSGGRELGIFKQKVDEYADANSLYKLALKEKWAVVATFNDEVRFREHIGSLF